MADAKQKKAEPKARGPVRYLAFAEIEPGWWALVAAGREASSVYALRTKLHADLQEAEGTDAEATATHTLVIIPADQAHVVEAVREIAVTEKFSKIALTEADVPPLSQMIQGPPGVHVPTEADIAARMGAGAPPPPGVVAAGDAAAQAALSAEAGVRAGQVLPPDPDDDDDRNPDIDPATGVSRRTAAQATPYDEGRTVFPIDEADPV